MNPRTPHNPRGISCNEHGKNCSNQDTVRTDLPCDALGPVCLPTAYECGCDACMSR